MDEKKDEKKPSATVVRVGNDPFKTKWPLEVIREAERMYMEYTKPSVIAERLKVPYDTLQSWIKFKNWRVKRQMASDEAIKEITETKKGQLMNISCLILDRIEKSLEKTKDRELTVKDITAYAAMAANMEKLVRLSQGMATDIKEERSTKTHLNLKLTDKSNIMKIIKSDPFLELPEIKSEVIEVVEEKINEPDDEQ